MRASSTIDRALRAAEQAPPSEAVAAVTQELRDALGALDVAFLALDLTGRALVRLARAAAGEDHISTRAAELTDFLPLEGGPREQVLREQALAVVDGHGPEGPTWTVLAPVTERGEALGLLEMVLPEEPAQETLVEVRLTAHLLAFVLIANRRHTDLFEQSRRSTLYTLPAEVQRRLLPEAATCEGGAFTLSAWLEPASDVGGDTYDFSVGEDCLHLSVTDAMGHGIESALSATLGVGALRNSRRRGATLLEQVSEANEALVGHFERAGEGFVTGLLGRLELSTGVLTLVNAGHASPYLVRDGEAGVIELVPELPLGLYADAGHSSTEVQLLPGDRVVLVTDGVVERTVDDLDLAVMLPAFEHLHPREATREVLDAVLARSGGSLDDDALLVVLDWHGPGQRRTSENGSDAARSRP